MKKMEQAKRKKINKAHIREKREQIMAALDDPGTVLASAVEHVFDYDSARLKDELAHHDRILGGCVDQRSPPVNCEVAGVYSCTCFDQELGHVDGIPQRALHEWRHSMYGHPQSNWRHRCSKRPPANNLPGYVKIMTPATAHTKVCDESKLDRAPALQI